MCGEVTVPASKNASLPLMCLSLLTAEKFSFKNLPEVSDIQSLRNLLESLGVQILSPTEFHCEELKSVKADYDLVRKMRASILVLGPLLARTGQAIVSMPGGCAIGERPVDIHLEGLKKLGAEIKLEDGYIHAVAKKLVGTRLNLAFPSVTGTINLMMAGSLAEGVTEITNAAREPEVSEVGEALEAMGAKVEGRGTSHLKIHGQASLKGLENWSVQSDRIQLLTYLAAGAITKGKVTCAPYREGSIDAVIEKFRHMGCQIDVSDASITLESKGIIKSLNLETEPFPGFPTDAQAQFVSCLSLSSEESRMSEVRENIFENRFQHVSELRRMGADIRLEGNLARIQGVDFLKGASVMASDLRASASLVLAGLAAKGETNVRRIYHLDRGYQGLESKLEALGAKVWRASES